LRENIISNRKRIYDSFAGMFPTFEMFCQVMDQCTENYECLVIDNTSKSNRLEEQVFWYKADPHEEFTIGSRELWELHNQTMVDDENEEENHDEEHHEDENEEEYNENEDNVPPLVNLSHNDDVSYNTTMIGNFSQKDIDNVNEIVEMGFDYYEVIQMYTASGKDKETAINLLFENH
jgi:hypothetical protein